jgi:hypothetical protein
MSETQGAFAPLNLNTMNNSNYPSTSSSSLAEAFISTIREANKRVSSQMSLESNFKQISIDENKIQCKRQLIEQNMQPIEKLEVKGKNRALELATCPDFVSKSLKAVSPLKKCSPRKQVSPSKSPLTSLGSKIDLIGSKKSKKNLKRL